jgi:hypothetical protein
MHCGDEAEALQAQHPSAFLLLCQIARRAKWKDCRITKMKKGEALIGDWREAGIKSEMAYRIAKQTLADCGLATFQGTNKGTRAILTSTTIFSLTRPLNNDQEDERGNGPTANKERSNSDPTTTNHTDTRDTQSTQTQPEREARKPAKKFQKPTLEEVKAYALTLSPPGIDAEKFMAHYKSNGWKVGKNPMQDWKAAVDYWHRNDTTNQTAKPGPKRAEIPLDLGGRRPSAIRGIPPATAAPAEPDIAGVVSLYPKRHRQAEAEVALAAHVRNGADLDAVAAGTRAIAAIIQRMPGGAENIYVPSAVTFFQNRRWEDDPKTWLRNAGKNGAPIEELYRGGGRQATTIEIQLPPAKP